MPRRKKSCLARKEKYYYRQQKKRSQEEQSLNDGTSTREGWDIAMDRFFIIDGCDNTVNSPGLTEVVDNDGDYANEFYLVLDRSYKYNPKDDVDEIVQFVQEEKFIELNRHLDNCSFGDFTKLNDIENSIKFVNFYHQTRTSLKMCISVDRLFNANIEVHGNLLEKGFSFWNCLPDTFNSVKNVTKIFDKLQTYKVCKGNFESDFLNSLPKDKDFNSGYFEKIDVGEYKTTLRAYKCELLVPGVNIRCKACSNFRSTIRKMKSRTRAPITTSSKQTHSHMTKQDLIMKVDSLREKSRHLESDNNKMRKVIFNSIKSQGAILSKTDNDELLRLFDSCKDDVEKNFPDKNCLQRVFWDQQTQYARLTNKCSMRWHPMIIKWCLYMRSKSKKAYDAIKNTGFIALPSARTLFDYSHVLPSTTGFNSCVLKHLKGEAKELGMFESESNSYVGILQDEVKVAEGLVYDNNSGELIGFVNLNETCNQLMNIENILNGSSVATATTMLVLMVRGISSSLKYPLACFPTRGITAHLLYPILWEAVGKLEIDCDLKPIFITCDGAAPNRRFFELHSNAEYESEECFWTWNPYSYPRRKMYFVSDVPHLLKTVRNCFANSYSHNKKRCLWNDGESISWMHIVRLYEEHVENNLFSAAHKLTRSHVDLTPFSKMKVNLAAQVMSSTVANSLEELYGSSTSGTVKFIRHINRFFDCLNTRNLLEGTVKRNVDLDVYRSISDPRFDYLLSEFLGYFQKWQKSVEERSGPFSKLQKHSMQLSKQTLKGLRISVNSVVECSKFLLSEGVDYILTSRFNQDPLEEHFSHLRHKGGSNDNPSVYSVKNNLSQMRIIGSTALSPINGNITNKRKPGVSKIDDRPMDKRPRK